MEEHDAILAVKAFVETIYPDYPVGELVADQFESGWVVFSRTDPANVHSLRIGSSIFLIGHDGRIVESSSSLPPGVSEAEFTRKYGQS